MANQADYHLKLIIGDMTAKLAIVLAENEALREEIGPERLAAMAVKAQADKEST